MARAASSPGLWRATPVAERWKHVPLHSPRLPRDFAFDLSARASQRVWTVEHFVLLHRQSRDLGVEQPQILGQRHGNRKEVLEKDTIES